MLVEQFGAPDLGAQRVELLFRLTSIILDTDAPASAAGQEPYSERVAGDQHRIEASLPGIPLSGTRLVLPTNPLAEYFTTPLPLAASLGFGRMQIFGCNTKTGF
jgi:hypothetical protein